MAPHCSGYDHNESCPIILYRCSSMCTTFEASSRHFKRTAAQQVQGPDLGPDRCNLPDMLQPIVLQICGQDRELVGACDVQLLADVGQH